MHFRGNIRGMIRSVYVPLEHKEDRNTAKSSAMNVDFLSFDWSIRTFPESHSGRSRMFIRNPIWPPVKMEVEI